MREKVKTGTRYLGWSAGANLACPTIKTTNDMPIVDPGGLDALGLIGFQINPHYVNVSAPGHHGETRDERLAEFARVNPKLPVIALLEGAWLRVSGSSIELRGPHPVRRRKSPYTRQANELPRSGNVASRRVIQCRVTNVKNS